ncbi:hypothetical protein ACFSQE_17590 [Vogesella fluminis]|uniref:hypothetical protein n=1 Tax=Vogesella fluminis TaxID=1069161 RepID=UPI00363952FA
MCYALAAQLARHHQQTFGQAVQLNQALLNRQLDYSTLLLQQLAPAQAATPGTIGTQLPAFVVAAGFQHKVDTGSRDTFEVQQSYRRRTPFLIREYRDQSTATWMESSAWYPAPARSYYIPLANLHPDRPDGRLDYLQGLDLAADRFLRQQSKPPSAAVKCRPAGRLPIVMVRRDWLSSRRPMLAARCRTAWRSG